MAGRSRKGGEVITRKYVNHAHKGRALEHAIEVSAGSILSLVKVPNGTKYLAGGKTIPVKSPVDYMGTVTGAGKSICFDAKKCALVKSFPIGNRDHFPPHQREMLIRQGEAGAIAGLLVESEAAERFLWLGWAHIGWATESIAWIDSRWVDCGPTTHAIQFRNIPGIALPRGGNGDAVGTGRREGGGG
jgi:hypothetical protein